MQICDIGYYLWQNLHRKKFARFIRMLEHKIDEFIRVDCTDGIVMESEAILYELSEAFQIINCR